MATSASLISSTSKARQSSHTPVTSHTDTVAKTVSSQTTKIPSTTLSTSSAPPPHTTTSHAIHSVHTTPSHAPQAAHLSHPTTTHGTGAHTQQSLVTTNHSAPPKPQSCWGQKEGLARVKDQSSTSAPEQTFSYKAPEQYTFATSEFKMVPKTQTLANKQHNNGFIIIFETDGRSRQIHLHYDATKKHQSSRDLFCNERKDPIFFDFFLKNQEDRKEYNDLLKKPNKTKEEERKLSYFKVLSQEQFETLKKQANEALKKL